MKYDFISTEIDTETGEKIISFLTYDTEKNKEQNTKRKIFFYHKTQSDVVLTKKNIMNLEPAPVIPLYTSNKNKNESLKKEANERFDAAEQCLYTLRALEDVEEMAPKDNAANLKNVNAKAAIQTADTTVNIANGVHLSGLFAGLAYEPAIWATTVWLTKASFITFMGEEIYKLGRDLYQKFRSWQDRQTILKQLDELPTIRKRELSQKVNALFIKRKTGNLSKAEQALITRLETAGFNEGTFSYYAFGPLSVAASTFGGFGAAQLGLGFAAGMLSPPICFTIAFSCLVIASFKAAFNDGKKLRDREYYRTSWLKQCGLDVINTFKGGWRSILVGLLCGLGGAAVIVGLILLAATPVGHAMLIAGAVAVGCITLWKNRDAILNIICHPIQSLKSCGTAIANFFSDVPGHLVSLGKAIKSLFVPAPSKGSIIGEIDALSLPQDDDEKKLLLSEEQQPAKSHDSPQNINTVYQTSPSDDEQEPLMRKADDNSDGGGPHPTDYDIAEGSQKPPAENKPFWGGFFKGSFTPQQAGDRIIRDYKTAPSA